MMEYKQRFTAEYQTEWKYQDEELEKRYEEFVAEKALSDPDLLLEKMQLGIQAEYAEGLQSSKVNDAMEAGQDGDYNRVE